MTPKIPMADSASAMAPNTVSRPLTSRVLASASFTYPSIVSIR